MSLTRNARNDVQHRAESAKYHLDKLLEMVPNIPEAEVQEVDDATRFEDATLKAFGIWVLDLMGAEQGDVTVQVNAAQSMLRDLVGASTPLRNFHTVKTNPEDIFEGVDLSAADEDEIGIEPFDLGNHTSNGVS